MSDEAPEDREYESCAKCGGDLEWHGCTRCGAEGVTGHDCGEDTCCCLHPEDNVPCDICDGAGGWYRCFSCHPPTPEEA